MVETSPSRQRRPPCKKSKEMSDEVADATALTYLLTYLLPLTTALHVVDLILWSFSCTVGTYMYG